MKNSKMPEQFNFDKYWYTHILPMCNEVPEVAEAFAYFQNDYQEISERIYEDMIESEDVPAALEQYKKEHTLRLIESTILCYNIHWLQEQFEPEQVAEYLSLAIAKAFYPDKEWAVIGLNSGAPVVSDPERSLVFDFKNFSKLSGAASLVNAEDPEFKDDAAISEAIAFREKRIEEELARLAPLKQYLDENPEPRHLHIIKDEHT